MAQPRCADGEQEGRLSEELRAFLRRTLRQPMRPEAALKKKPKQMDFRQFGA
jgi:hypothetical protein